MDRRREKSASTRSGRVRLDGEELTGRGFAVVVVLFVAFDGDAEGAEEVEVVAREGSVLGGAVAGLAGGSFFFVDFIEADGGLEHQQDVEAVFADVLHHSGDLLAFNDRFVDSLSELLDEFAQVSVAAGCQGLPPVWRRARERRGSAQVFTTLLPSDAGGNRGNREFCVEQDPVVRCYHHIGMKPEKIGRVLGVGLRVAGRMASERMSSSATVAAPAAAQPAGAASRSAGQAAGAATKGVASGVGGFLRPFRRVGGTIWLEVTGVFFFLPVLVFAPTIWRTRASWEHGPDHRLFVAAAIVVAVFFYLGVTSFWRARRR